MSKEYDSKSLGGLMDEIQALIAPPGEEKKKKEGLSLHPYFRRPGRGHNHDRCDACGEGGDLLCCDRCPSSFHFGCHDPPIPMDDIPSGDWICHNCKATEALNLGARPAQYELPPEHAPSEEALAVRSPLLHLIRAASLLNPKQFELPPEMVVNDLLPGETKIVPRGSVNRKKPHELDNGLVPLPAKLCYKCNKSCRVAPLLACDYCSSCFHLDCLDPPLTTMPTGSVWMCPLHVENFLDSQMLTSTRLTERLKLWSKFSGPIDQDAVKMNFLKRVHRKHPPFRRKIRILNENLVEVPEAVKSHYKNPLPAPAPYPRVDGIRRNSSAQASEQEQELWLKSVLSLQLAASDELHHRAVAALDVTIKQEPIVENDKMDVGDAHENKPEVTTNGTCDDRDYVPNRLSAAARGPLLDSVLKARLTDLGESWVRSGGSGSDSAEQRQLRARLAAAGSLDLDALDPRLVKLLVMQRLQQLLGPQAGCRLAPRTQLDPRRSAESLVTPRAALTPLNGLGDTEYIRYRSAKIGSGAQNDVNLDSHGFCRFVSGQHAILFFDQASGRFELLNYSEYGTVVEGVLYACDLSGRAVTTAADAPSDVETAVREIAEQQRRRSGDNPADAAATMSRRPCLEQRRCHCLCALAGLPDSPRRGFESSALLRHGSLVQFGCLRFVFAEMSPVRAGQRSVVGALLERRKRYQGGGDSKQTADGAAADEAQHWPATANQSPDQRE